MTTPDHDNAPSRAEVDRIKGMMRANDDFICGIPGELDRHSYAHAYTIGMIESIVASEPANRLSGRATNLGRDIAAVLVASAEMLDETCCIAVSDDT